MIAANPGLVVVAPLLGAPWRGTLCGVMRKAIGIAVGLVLAAIVMSAVFWVLWWLLVVALFVAVAAFVWRAVTAR